MHDMHANRSKYREKWRNRDLNTDKIKQTHRQCEDKEGKNVLPRIARNKVGGFPLEGYCRTNSSGTLLHGCRTWMI
jgi:hypothetical protein